MKSISSCSTTLACAVAMLFTTSSRALNEDTGLARPNLTGRIAEKGGAGLPGATVFVYSAGPRVGISPYCPTCYTDCRKSATTDVGGKFTLESLSPDLIFKILAVDKDRKPTFLARVDPAKGPIEIALEKLDRGHLGPKQQLEGKVIDPEGKPVFGAVVNFDEFNGDEANCGGQCDGVDLVTVTDSQGHFLMTSEKRFDEMSLTVEARGLAKRRFTKLESGKFHELKLTEGVSVSGRILADGKPIKNVSIGLLSTDRSTGAGNFDVGTNEEGRFLFSNIPAYESYFIYGMMDSLKEHGAVPIKKIRLSADGSSKNVGDLQILPAHRIRGKVILADGNPIPPNIRVLVGRADAWDTQIIPLEPGGFFEARGIPNESISVSVMVPGYFVSEKNKSLDKLNGGTIEGRVTSDIPNLMILMEKGRYQPPNYNKLPGSPEDWQPRDKPLEGATAR